MIKYILLIIIFTQAKWVLCQEKIKKFDNFIGYQARLMDLMPSEISYLRIAKEKGLSFALRGGFGEGQITVPTISSYMTYNFGEMEQTYKAYFIKFGVILPIVKEKWYAFYNVFNYNINRTSNKLIVNSFDWLYNTYREEYNEYYFNQSLEYEANIQFKLTRKFYYGIGYIVGHKINNKIPFKGVFPVFEKLSNYTPSQGFGDPFYMNVSLSVMYKL